MLSTVLFLSAGNGAATCGLGALALLTGQLSIGWSNDLIDGARDVAAHRPGKPLASGALDRQLLRRCCAVAVLVTVTASLALGWRPGLIHLTAVAAGWSYNLGLKSRIGSPLPYLFAFAALPVIATAALPEPRWPPFWTVLAAGLIGAGAHFANVLPDLPQDVAAGVLGLPQRIGAVRSAVAAAVLTVAATCLVLLAPGTTAGWLVGAVLLTVVVLVAAGIRSSLLGRGAESTFYATMLCAALDVGLIAASGSLSG